MNIVITKAAGRIDLFVKGALGNVEVYRGVENRNHACSLHLHLLDRGSVIERLAVDQNVSVHINPPRDEAMSALGIQVGIGE